ncbi:SpoIIE family protein phosphatase [Streptomyces tubbatahanensis]|uniref:SpoIIE family protein phosphatase n=1 Tax=Streptomyces tubbatahanensis TaxID=2923272 RepID=A0ABY3XU82_9ACTN|nr:SpoIIE family protein phosphatase [Streptomyces tubbatahanensis]UNS97995.1 SpoIIE family protein phosphatase [Streptomyces tubbatahanensis]
MRTDDALAALGAGLWTWDDATGLVTLDTRAARLLGVDDSPVAGLADPAVPSGPAGPADSAGPTVAPSPSGAPPGDGRPAAGPAPRTETHLTLPGSAVRSHLHAVDYVGFQSIVTLALAEETTAEALLRVVDADGAVVGTVRTVVRPAPRAPAGTGQREEGAPGLVGLVYAVPEPEERPEQQAAGPLTRAAPGDRGGRGDRGNHGQDVAGPRGRGAAAAWDWRRNREAFLLDAGRALAEAYTTADVLRVAASLAMPGFSPDALAVFCVSGDQLTVYGASPGAPARPGYPYGPGHPYGPGGGLGPPGSGAHLRLTDDDPAAEAVRTGRALYLLDPREYADRFPAARPAETQPGRTAWAFLPLTVAGRTIGAWMAAFAQPVAFTPDERAVLTTVARMLAQSLSRALLNESERELSARLQRAMRPAHSPAVPGMDLAARYVPTGGGLQIGGDWYDVIPLPSGRTALVIGDVQGHDVRAAGIMGQLRVAVRAYASEGHHPDAVLSRASRFLHGMGAGARVNAPPPSAPAEEAAGFPPEAGADEEEPETADPRFATCLYVEVDPATGTLDVARAGHPDPAVQLPDGPMMVRPTAGGLPLGIEPDSDYPVTRLVLEPGERLLMCTDGLLEAGGHDQETGWERINEVVEGLRTRPDDSEAEAGSEPGVEPGPEPGVELGPEPGSGSGLEPGLEQVADALVRAAHGDECGTPARTAAPPLTPRREDDIALLLLARGARTEGLTVGGTPVSARRTVMQVAQAQPDRIATARHQLRDLLHDWADPEQVDGAVLMLSEMLTNVLVHTDGDATLVAQITAPRAGATANTGGAEGEAESGARGGTQERTLRVNVSDASDELPHRRSPGELASSGRGLMLLGMLADRWGVDPRGEGKCIWFEMQEADPAAKDVEEAAEPSLDQWEAWDLSALDED